MIHLSETSKVCLCLELASWLVTSCHRLQYVTIVTFCRGAQFLRFFISFLCFSFLRGEFNEGLVSCRLFNLGSLQCGARVSLTSFRKRVLAWCTVDAETGRLKLLFLNSCCPVLCGVAAQCTSRIQISRRLC